jgi:hypothetical protein
MTPLNARTATWDGAIGEDRLGSPGRPHSSTTLDYHTNRALGWIILATRTRFTIDSAGHGMLANIGGSEDFEHVNEVGAQAIATIRGACPHNAAPPIRRS